MKFISVSEPAFRQWLIDYTQRQNRHLGMSKPKPLPQQEGWLHRDFPDASTPSTIPAGLVVAYVNYHPTDEALHQYYVCEHPEANFFSIDVTKAAE